MLNLKCFDTYNLNQSLLGVMLIVAGHLLSLNATNRVHRIFGGVCLAFGLIVVAMVLGDQDINEFDYTNRTFLIALGGALAIIVGTFLTYYHANNLLKQGMNMLNVPALDKILCLVGTVALLYAASQKSLKRAVMLGLALAVMYYFKMRMLQACCCQRTQVNYILSWGLVVLALGFDC